MFVRTCAAVAGFVVCFPQGLLANESGTPVRFQLLPGSLIVHEHGQEGTGCFGEFFQEEIGGSFILELMQGTNEVFGKIHDIDFHSIHNNSYSIVGRGSYAESNARGSHIARPPNIATGQLILKINDFPEVELGHEPVGFNDFIFPRFSIFVSSTTLMRRDCFKISFQAIPVDESVLFFHRSDVDGNGKRDMTDAIILLNHLFLSGEEPSCVDAEDANDDGRVDITDSIEILTYLFRGGALAPIPSAFCGVDPTPDDLGCQGQPACTPEL